MVFYYDFDLETSLSTADLAKITEEMQKIIAANLPITRKVLPREEAIQLMQDRGEDYKIELIKELSDREISFYQQGQFIDLCRGPHLPATGQIKAFKLLEVAGAYWRGDENRKMLQRIYGTAFRKKSALTDYLHKREELKRRP